ncbi:poly(A) polymerase [Enteropsectra breve]|nr:poly(A) polymerase [Enteropsectra breve]
MMDEQKMKYGVTGAVTFKESEKTALDLSEALAKYLEDSGFFESEESAQLRERVLGRLDFMAKKFVRELGTDASRDYGGVIFTFGSYRLGVHDRGADIDALCVVPRHVYRKDFFNTFFSELAADKNVTDLSKIEDAFVPLIKMKFHGIPIDLTFARLSLSAVKSSVNLLNNTLLKMMDEKCIVSLNGSRVTDSMLQLVPNTSTFHQVLRAIKFWAKRRCVYGASYGYFGGVAFSISVARVCQLYPNYSPYDTLCKYFEFYAAWKWPSPIFLCPILNLNYNFKVWDPKTNPSDKYHKMPIITPAYPSMCSTHNVSQSTMGVIVSEFERGHMLLSDCKSISLIQNNDIPHNDIHNKMKVDDIDTKNNTMKVDNIDINNNIKDINNIMKVDDIKDINNNIKDINNIMKVDDIKDINNIEVDKSLTPAISCFDKLFEINDFFKNYKIFIQIKAVAGSKSEMLSWGGYIESKVRIMGTKLEILESISMAVPYPKAYRTSENVSSNNDNNDNENINNNDKAIDNKAINDKKDNNKKDSDEENENRKMFRTNEEESCTCYSFFYIGIELQKTRDGSKKLFIDAPVKEFLDFVNAWEHKTKDMKVEISAVKRKEVQMVIKRCTSEE